LLLHLLRHHGPQHGCISPIPSFLQSQKMGFAGLEKCLEQNPDGIEFFKIDVGNIVLVSSPYYLFNECLIGNTAINDDFLEFIKAEESRL
jgi:hypothetical protein